MEITPVEAHVWILMKEWKQMEGAIFTDTLWDIGLQRSVTQRDNASASA